MTTDPVQDLIDQLKLMRVELNDVKKRQLTEERLKHLQAALEDNAKQIAGVQDAAMQGGEKAASYLIAELNQTTAKMEQKTEDAVRGLTEARRAASGTVLARRRNVWLLMGLSALTGLATGAILALLVFDYALGREFKDSVKLMGWEWACKRNEGTIHKQGNGKYCIFQIDG